MARISDAGLALIEDVEGIKLAAYLDTGGVPTIGVGHTFGVKMGQVCTAEQAREWLREDVEEAEKTIRAKLPSAILESLPQPAWDALTSFVFNLGSQALRNPSGSPTGISRAIIDQRFHDVPAQMMRWVYDNGRRLKGLENRRKKEGALWASGWAK